MSPTPAAKCAICEAEFSRDRPTHPFCSMRCKWVDLGHWLDGNYAVPGDGAIDFDAVGD